MSNLSRTALAVLILAFLYGKVYLPLGIRVWDVSLHDERMGVIQ